MRLSGQPNLKHNICEYALAQMDTTATIILRSGKMWRLFKGGICVHFFTVRIFYSMHMASQVDEAFCFDSSVDSTEGWRDVVFFSTMAAAIP